MFTESLNSIVINIVKIFPKITILKYILMDLEEVPVNNPPINRGLEIQP
jgi:hypothetical protein